MPVLWDQAMWEALYQHKVGREDHAKFGQVIKGLTREFAVLMQNPHSDGLDFYALRRDALIAALGLVPTDRIVVVGCGFGFLIEVFHDAGFPAVWGVESSPWIIAGRATETRPDVLYVEDDVRASKVGGALKKIAGAGGFDYVITEDVISSYTQSETADVFTACEGLLAPGRPASSAVHLVTTTADDGSTGDSAFTWLDLTQWKALQPSHTFMRSGTFEVL